MASCQQHQNSAEARQQWVCTVGKPVRWRLVGGGPIVASYSFAASGPLFRGAFGCSVRSWKTNHQTK